MNTFWIFMAVLCICLTTESIMLSDKSKPSCTESFCQGDKVRIVDTQKIGTILEYKGDHSNKVWQIYVDSEKLFYIIPENRLNNEE